MSRPAPLSPDVRLRVWLAYLCRVERYAIEAGDEPALVTPDLDAEQLEQIAHLDAVGTQAMADAERLTGARTRVQQNRLWRRGVEALGQPPAEASRVEGMAATKTDKPARKKTSGTTMTYAERKERGKSLKSFTLDPVAIELLRLMAEADGSNMSATVERLVFEENERRNAKKDQG